MFLYVTRFGKTDHIVTTSETAQIISYTAVKKLGARLEKGCDEKDVKSKGQPKLCRNAVGHIKNFDNDDPRVMTIKFLM